MSDGHGEMPRLLGRFAGGSGDATTPPASASLRAPPRRVFCQRKRRAGHKRRKWGRARNEGRHAGPTGGKETSRVTRSGHHRVFRPPGRVRPGRSQSSKQLPTFSATGEQPAVRYWRQGGPKFPVAAERELRTLAGSLGRADEWAGAMAAMDIGSDFGPSKHRSSKEADGAWRVISKVVPETRVSSATPGLRVYDGGGGTPVPPGSGRTYGNDRGTRIGICGSSHPNSRRSQGEVNQPGSADDLPCAVDPTVSKEKKQDQRQRKKQRQHSKEVRPPRVSNDKGPRRGWLGDLTDGILPDDGLYIGRSKTVPGGQQGWGNPWKANGSLHSHQKVVKH